MIPDLNRLKTFYYVYLRRSVSAAAGELYVTQSAVSQSLKNLERELKHPLFNRAGRRLVPTREGERLFGLMAPFVRDLENALADGERESSGPCGLLRVGAPAEFGSKYLVGICARFRRDYPAVSFAMTLGHPSRLLPELAGGNLDMAFADIFSSAKEYSREYAVFSIRLVAREKLVLACSREYRRKNLPGKADARSLLKCAFLDYNTHGAAVRGWFGHHYRMAGAKPEIALAAESVQAVISGIKSGMGLGVVPEYLIARELASGALAKIKTGKPDLINRISLLRLKGAAVSPAEKAFTESFLKASKDF